MCVKPGEEFVLPLLPTEEIFTSLLKNETIENKEDLEKAPLFSSQCASAK